MNLFIAVIAAMSLLCYSPKTGSLDTFSLIPFESSKIDGGGIVDVVSTLSSIDVYDTPHVSGRVEIQIFNDSGTMVADQNLVVIKDGVAKFPKNTLAVGLFEAVVDFPTGTEKVFFEIN